LQVGSASADIDIDVELVNLEPINGAPAEVELEIPPSFETLDGAPSLRAARVEPKSNAASEERRMGANLPFFGSR
jgi:hypothetical protein